MSVELHAHTRGSLKPDPELDPVLAIFYFIHNDWPDPDSGDGGRGGGGGDGGGSSRGSDGIITGQNCKLGVIAIDIDNCGFTAFVGKEHNRKAPPNATPTKKPGSPKATDSTKTKKSPSKDDSSNVKVKKYHPLNYKAFHPVT